MRHSNLGFSGHAIDEVTPVDPKSSPSRRTVRTRNRRHVSSQKNVTAEVSSSAPLPSSCKEDQLAPARSLAVHASLSSNQIVKEPAPHSPRAKAPAENPPTRRGQENRPADRSPNRSSLGRNT